MKFLKAVSVFSFILISGLTSAQAAEIQRCWELDPSAEPIAFTLPEQICIQSAQVHWREDYPTHNLVVTGTPYAGQFVLEELDWGETPHSVLVQATLKSQIQSDPNCYMKRGAMIRFRFEVSFDTKTVYNSKIWTDYFEADQNCRNPQGPRTIAYYPVE